MQRPTAISYAIFALLLVVVGLLHLTTPFIGALFCFLALTKLRFWGRKWLAVTLFIVLLAAAFSGFGFILKRALVALPEMVETTVPVVLQYAAKYGIDLPFNDTDSLRAVALDAVRSTLGDVGQYVKFATKEFVFLVIGIVIAVGVFLNPDFEPRKQRSSGRPNLYTFYTAKIRERFASFYRNFETVIGAQIVISAINTALSSVFVLAAGLRYAGVLVALTFVCGLIPIVGNLISNTIIIGVAFAISPKLALWGFAFLVIVHKLEYFLNSRIIGGRTHHPMWLMLLALLIGDSLLGIPGIILAPVVLSFVKVEMSKVEVGSVAAPVSSRREPQPRAELTGV
ncbi:MAG: AI-2E family transporter [Chthoniobacterales bacterium]